MDGKQVRGSKRSRRGDRALHLLSCFVHGLGLTLLQGRVGDEAVAGKKLLAQLEGLAGIPWLFNAAFAERPLVEAVLEKNGMYLLDLKDNLAVKSYAEWTFSLERCKEDTSFEVDEVRSGEPCGYASSKHVPLLK